MRKSMLPPSGENLFQRIKRQCAVAESAGRKLIKLSIGQPSGPALIMGRHAASLAVLSALECMHEYQDNGSPGVPNFAKKFVQAHIKTDLDKVENDAIDFLPIPGIKPMLGVVIDSLGAWSEEGEFTPSVVTMTNPGYPTPKDQCQLRTDIFHESVELDPLNGFLFDQEEATDMLGEGDLIMLNFPHNPTGIIATREWLRELCRICEDVGIRVFNDAAYAILSHTEESVTLTDVALEFPNLNWAEAFSASKAGNFTGWRIGAMAGSREFIDDVKRIKGNTDSGFAAPLAAGVLNAFENGRRFIADYQRKYDERLDILIGILTKRGMKLAVDPKAGFFALFHRPTTAFGQRIGSADQFNDLMIERTGVVGVPFDPYIRYAVCTTDIEAASSDLEKAFDNANASL